MQVVASSHISHPYTLVSAHCMCHSFMLVIALYYVSVQILQERDTSALLPNPKGQRSRWLCESRARQHCNTSPMQLTLPNIIVDVISSDHRVYSNNDSTSDSTSYAIASDDFMRSHNLVIGYFTDIIITDSTAGQRN